MPSTPFDWSDIIADYGRYMTAIGRPRTTRMLRQYQIEHMAVSINLKLEHITYNDLIDYFGRNNWKPETRRNYRSGIRGFFAWAKSEGRITEDPADKIPQVKQGKAVPRPAPDLAYNTAIAAADQRATLMLRLAAEAGLRRSEVARVHTEDLRITPRGAQLIVHGKGNRERAVPITDSLAALIQAGPAGHTHGAATSGWLFPSQRGAHLTPQYVGLICSRLLPGIWSMHTLRHRFATRAYAGSHDLRAIQMLLGHANPSITERYVATDDDAMRAAMMAAVAA